MTKSEFKGVVALLSGYYGERFRVDDHFTLDVWYQELKDLDAADVVAGVRQMARESDVWPTIANVRRWSENDVALEDIWSQVYRAICYHGPYGRWNSELRRSEFPSLSLDAAYAVERVGGARAILEAPDDKTLGFLRRDFIAALKDARLGLKRQALSQACDAILPASGCQEALSSVADVISDLTRKTGA